MKTAYILNQAMRLLLPNLLREYMKKETFSLVMTDQLIQELTRGMQLLLTYLMLIKARKFSEVL